MKPIIITLLLILLLSNGVAETKEPNPYTDINDLRDPLIPPEGFEKIDKESEALLKQKFSDAKIMGIAIDGNKKYVIINNAIIQEKGTWREIVIDKINIDHLIVVYQGESSKIPYKKSSEK